MELKPVNVVVRIRPAFNTKPLALQWTGESSLEMLSHRNTEESIKYSFSRVFHPESTQASVYETAIKPLVANITNGQNASVLAYGQTGAGKTYTMMGSPDNVGIVPRSLQTIFQLIEKQPSAKFTVKVSYLEIYQEKVHDLLAQADKTRPQQDLPIRQTPSKDILIPTLAEKVISSPEEFRGQFAEAMSMRHVGATLLNERSSRSHVIVLVKVVREENNRRLSGKLYLVDLAGSEDNRRTGNAGIRLKESGSINTSLFYLGQVVDALNNRNPAVPYRSSKLTRLLQDSLGGNSNACIISCICPEECNYFDTLRALKFASKIERVKNPVKINEVVIEDPDTTVIEEKITSSVETETMKSSSIPVPTLIENVNRHVPAIPHGLSPALRVLDEQLTKKFAELESKLISHMHSEASMLLEESIMVDRTFMQRQLESSRLHLTQLRDTTRRSLMLPCHTSGALPPPNFEDRDALLDSTLDEQSDRAGTSEGSRDASGQSSPVLNDMTTTSRKRYFPSVLGERSDASPELATLSHALHLTDVSICDNVAETSESKPSSSTMERQALEPTTGKRGSSTMGLTTLEPAVQRRRSSTMELSSLEPAVGRRRSSTIDLRTSEPPAVRRRRSSTIELRNLEPPAAGRRRSSALPVNNQDECHENRRTLRPRRPSLQSSALNIIAEKPSVQLQEPLKPKNATKRVAVAEQLRASSDDYQRRRRAAILKLLNSGSVRRLCTLQTLGQKRAQMVFDYREYKGPFRRVEDLARVPGFAKSFYRRFAKSNLLLAEDPSSDSEQENLYDIAEESDDTFRRPEVKASKKQRITCAF
ncbi:PREDICTED: kinesin-like protein KIF22 [Priapulus caudatus]|uniref:Kinesin-like protein n=1 Tax=Priapulus caudatus TaxID=37621 RepID=A0ABM1E4T3_PRICU|nr:PREDICTED: kinesin-like protein KIF22 [Priapulus caudatus]XP_014667203.1 PREDICTED: kinesin-like protein KIF22 [Priapulus caudatus]XP_014667204.1 PREDICTED: kinesin-like protein KIF22 [Priapulus caudatus]